MEHRDINWGINISIKKYYLYYKLQLHDHIDHNKKSITEKFGANRSVINRNQNFLIAS